VNSFTNRNQPLHRYNGQMSATNNPPANFDLAAVTVLDVPTRQRFEAHYQGRTIAYADYRPSSGSLMFSHSEVNEGLEGLGVGGLLVRTALEAARARGLLVVPMCPFFVAYLSRHHEYLDLVHPLHQRVFGL
jgi:uncharacterized protein